MELLDDDDLLDLGAKRAAPAAEMPDANSALSAWANVAEDTNGKCHACDRGQKLQCKSCQRPACASHSWFMLGVCRDCATEDRVSRWNKQSQAGGSNWLEDA